MRRGIVCPLGNTKIDSIHLHGNRSRQTEAGFLWVVGYAVKGGRIGNQTLFFAIEPQMALCIGRRLALGMPAG
jgi:hypothetical protein